MLNVNKKIGIAVGVLAIAALGFSLGLSSKTVDTGPVQRINVEAVTTPVIDNAHTTSGGTPAAQVNAVKTNNKNVLVLNTQVSESSVNQIIEQLKVLDGSKETIYLLLDSPGGSVFDGARLISQMEAMKTPVNTVCIGMCASMAAMIHSYGKERLMTNRAVLMYHPASGGLQGQLQNMQSRLTMVSNYVAKLEANVQKRSGLSKAYYDNRIAYEFWVDSDEAKQLKLTDGIVSISAQIPSKQLGGFDDSKRNTTTLDWIYTGSFNEVK